MSILEVSKVSKHFGGIRAVSNVSFSVAAGEILACVGPNAAGKTTLLNLVTGWQRPDEGHIYITGQPVQPLTPEAFASKGVVRTFQRARLFRKQTVLENLLLASRPQSEETLSAALFFRKAWLNSQSKEVCRAEEILKALGIFHLSGRPASALSGGEQRLAELAVAAARRAKILLLDEPVANLSQEAKQVVAAFLLRQTESGVACVIVEHDLEFVRKVADNVLILARGSVFGHGRSEDPLTWETVERCYLSSPTEPTEKCVGFVNPNGNQLKHVRELSYSKSRSKFRQDIRAVKQSGSRHYESLVVRGLCVSYGRGVILQDINIDVCPGEIVALIGGNGAGKSTTLRSIMGLVPYRGSIKLGQISLTSLQPYDISRLGISCVSQHRKVFPSLTVLENLLLACDLHSGPIQDRLGPALHAFPELEAWFNVPAGQLSGGQQQMVALGRALLQKPRILLLDEPSAGLSENTWCRVTGLLMSLAEEGLPILLVEHRPSTLSNLLSRGYLIRRGRITAQGPWKVISTKKSLRETLIGSN